MTLPSLTPDALPWALLTLVLAVLVFGQISNARQLARIERILTMPVTQSQVLADVTAAQGELPSNLTAAGNAVTTAIDSAAANGQDLTDVRDQFAAYRASVNTGITGIVTLAESTLTAAEGGTGNPPV